MILVTGATGLAGSAVIRTFGVRPTTFAGFAERNADVFRGAAPASHLWASGWQSPATAG